MSKIQPAKFYKPRDIAKLGLITNSKGKGDYLFTIRLIKEGKLKAVDYARGNRPFWLVSEKAIENYHKQLQNAH